MTYGTYSGIERRQKRDGKAETYSGIERRQIRRTSTVRFCLLGVACTFAGIAIGAGGSVVTGKVAHLLHLLLAVL